MTHLTKRIRADKFLEEEEGEVHSLPLSVCESHTLLEYFEFASQQSIGFQRGLNTVIWRVGYRARTNGETIPDIVIPIRKVLPQLQVPVFFEEPSRLEDLFTEDSALEAKNYIDMNRSLCQTFKATLILQVDTRRPINIVAGRLLSDWVNKPRASVSVVGPGLFSGRSTVREIIQIENV